MPATPSTDLVDEFAAGWCHGSPPPDVWEFLRHRPGAGGPAVVAVLLADLRRRYAAGCPRPVEEYLAAAAVGADPERRLDLVYGDYRAAQEYGPAPDAGALAARFPDLADRLALHVALGGALDPSATGGGPAPETTDPDATTDFTPRPAGEAEPDAATAPPGYEFVRELGRGGFGTVWLARHLRLDKLVAVKSMHASVAGRVANLMREARMMARLKAHPNRVKLFGLVESDDRYFLVMDYVAGGSLAALVEPGRPLDWVRATRYVADAAGALAEVHARGLLHRDIKPENVLLDADRDAAVLGDFGMMTMASPGTGGCGTPGYMAPELFAEAASEKSEVFALAATLLHLVTGRRTPRPGRPAVAAAALEAQGLPAALRGATLAGLRPDPRDRPDLATFMALLRECHAAGLTERIAPRSRGCPVTLRVAVATATEADADPRTIYRGTPGGPWPVVRGDGVIRLEAEADADGYLTVLTLSSDGEVAVSSPNPLAPDNRVTAGRPQRLTVWPKPPAGTDYAVLLWTPQACPRTPREWREGLESRQFDPNHGPARGVATAAADDPEGGGPHWVAAVVGIEHGD